MSEPEIKVNQVSAQHGGFRAGAGRKRGSVNAAEYWAAFEQRVRAAASKELTAAKLRELAQRDPWRFLERIVLPLIGMNKRGNARFGVSLENADGSKAQFVLDLGADEPSEREQAESVLAELHDYTAGDRQP